MRWDLRPGQVTSIWLTDKTSWHRGHSGLSPRQSKCRCVSYVCPILSRHRVTSSRLDFLFAESHCASFGLTASSLVFVAVQLSCHFFIINTRMAGKRSRAGRRDRRVTGAAAARLAAASANSFPEIPTCAGIQQNLTVFPARFRDVILIRMSWMIGLCVVKLRSAIKLLRESVTGKVVQHYYENE